MSTSVTVGSSTYILPQQGDPAPWGTDLSDVISAITEALSSVVGPSDINTTSFDLANNQSSAANLTGLTFDTSTVRAAIVQYSIYRTSSTTEKSEVGTIYLAYKSTAATWELAQTYAGDSGITFSITSAGQVQYTSSNFSGISYSGKLKFKATAFLQA